MTLWAPSVKVVDALYQARYLISLHNGMTVRCDGEEWALDFAQESQMIDATLKLAGVDIQRVRHQAQRPTKAN
ncbi:hypothetical protein [Paraburkholderia diazotrophica]|uniref:Uncharacterized protein n=1 Tax=Paraburkholderia diazotrophica TaxID=667676 RepID=A0A1H7BPS0_9BURK|nr:hypothetical protein [Paraburkholderia diazotrophica]SEJ76290.1 hypothetical protein SAMN05192539_1017145 [Paraburkholderia diazotrophica]